MTYSRLNTTPRTWQKADFEPGRSGSEVPAISMTLLARRALGAERVARVAGSCQLHSFPDGAASGAALGFSASFSS